MSSYQPEAAIRSSGVAVSGVRRSRAVQVARRRDAWVAYALMAPALAIVAVVMAYPVAWEVWTSLTSCSVRSEGRAFVGLANYQAMVADARFWSALTVTVAYFALTTGVKLALGLAMALLLTRPSRWRGVVFLAVFLPWAYPGGVTVVAWYWMLNPPLITSYSLLAGNVKHAVDGVFGPGAWAFARAKLSSIKLENVVKPPSTPTKTNARSGADRARRPPAKAPASRPTVSDPARLTVAVA